MKKRTDNPFQLKLQQELRRRQQDNHRYSLRAFSRDLDTSAATLKVLLDGKHLPTSGTIKRIAGHLRWTKEESDSIQRSLRSLKVQRRERAKDGIREPNFSILKDLLGLALLGFIRQFTPPHDAAFIAETLGVKVKRVEETIELLITQGLITSTKGVLQPNHRTIFYVQDPAGQEVQAYKKKFLEHAIDQMSVGSPEEANSILFYFPCSPKDKKRLATVLNAFRRDIEEKFPPKAESELYCAGALVFPFKIKS